MCGIAGFVDFKKKYSRRDLINMTDCLQYRGPDGADYAVFENSSNNIGLGHRRLAILDLSPLGKQPMTSADGNYTIIFNGEVYNFNEIKKELEAKGYSFRSASDTETILYAYIEWGIEAVHRFVGMFAIAIYDRVKQQLILLRDRAGVKPLYYYKGAGLFLFASELKSFLTFSEFPRTINTDAFKSFLSYSFVPAPLSIFENTFKLEAGHHAVLDLSTKELEKTQYWDPLEFYNKPKNTSTINDIMPELEERLRKACEYRMVSDVPVGIFLSGGYDSTLVTALLQSGRTEKLKTFTIGFEDERYDESGYAKEVASLLETDHHELICTNNDARETLIHLADYFDEPFGDSSSIPTTLISHFARKHVTVALSADGGDELFAGYKRYDAILQLFAKYQKQPKAISRSIGLSLQSLPNFIIGRMLKGNTTKENIAKYADFFKGNIDIVDLIDFANRSAMPDFLSPFLGAGIQHDQQDYFRKNEIRKIADPLDRLLGFDYLCYLPGDILTKIDRATMSASLEGREPLLDHQLFEFVAQLPSNLKYDSLTSKLIMRKITHKFVPERIMNRPKKGFSVPVIDWFRGDLKYLLEETLTKDKVEAHGLINYKRLREELDKYYKGQDFYFPLLWNLYVFQSWYDKWIKK